MLTFVFEGRFFSLIIFRYKPQLKIGIIYHKIQVQTFIMSNVLSSLPMYIFAWLSSGGRGEYCLLKVSLPTGYNLGLMKINLDQLQE